MSEQSNPMGRPPAVTPEVLQKLEHAFSIGCSDIEASLYANISPRTLYHYQKENPDFLQRKQQLKEKPVLKARAAIVGALDKNDLDIAKWYLERKRKTEFSTRQELTGRDGGAIEVTAIDPSKLSDSTIEELMNARKEKLDYIESSDTVGATAEVVESESTGLDSD